MIRQGVQVLEVHNPLNTSRLAQAKPAARLKLKKSMTRNPLKDGEISENSLGVGTVTPKMVRERAEELAIIISAPLNELSAADFEQARQDLTGEPDMASQTLESATESERWDPVTGSTGHKAPVAPSDDEDEEGRSDNERLVEEGVAGAEHDHLIQAARESANTDNS
jgi:hypothetical protein